MKKRASAKPTGSGAQKNDQLLIRLNELEKDTFRDAADLAGQALSVWVRDRLRQSAKKELEDGGKPVRFIAGY